MNKIYSFKSLFLMMVCFAFAGTVSAQAFTLVPGNTVTTQIAANGFIEPEVQALNNTGGDLTRRYELLSNTLNSGWSILFCDNVNCYVGAWQNGTMDPIATGVQEMIFKVTFDPQNTQGTGSLVYRVWDETNPTDVDTVTFNFEVTPAVGIEDELLEQIKVYPQPAQSELSVEIPARMTGVELQLLDLSGAEVARQTVNGTQAVMDLSNLAKGFYVLRFNSELAVLNKRIVIH